MASQNLVGESALEIDFIAIDALKTQRAQAEGDSPRQLLLTSYIEQFEPRDGRLPLATVSHFYASRLEKLAINYPNFAEVIAFIREELAMAMLLADGTIELPGFILEGPPGIGKTRFLHDLAGCLSLHFECIDIASASAGFELGGASGVWRGGRPGRVVDAICRSQQANPVILLDEIDRISENRNYPVDGPLYTLLERFTAKNFMDEYLRVRSNCSHINWVATCNNFSRLPDPIRSRFLHFSIAAPQKNQRSGVVQSIYDDVLDENRWGKAFSKVLNQDVVLYLVEKEASPRALKRILRQAAINAALRTSRQTNGSKLSEIAINIFDFSGDSKTSATQTSWSQFQQ